MELPKQLLRCRCNSRQNGRSGTRLKFALIAGKTLLISGPASLRLEKGSAEIFKTPLRPKQKLIIKNERQLPIEIVDDSILEAEFGERASYLEVDGSTFPNSWSEAVEAFQELDGGKTIVIGSTDTGKSTFCTFLVNSQLKIGSRVAVIDADIGQSDLGPPGSLGLSIAEKPLIELENSRIDSMIFIGETSPSKVVERVIQGILRLEERIPEDTSIVVNTDGWVVNDEAVAFKAKMIAKLKPDLVVGIAEGRELDPIFDKIVGPTMKIETPKFIRVRGREERRRLREYGYMRYMRDAIHKNFSLDKIKVEHIPTRRCEEGDILGFLDKDGLMMGIGVLEYLNRTRRVVRAYTNVPSRGVTKIECGSIRLSHNGLELSR